jgi:hypothetical protein
MNILEYHANTENPWKYYSGGSEKEDDSFNVQQALFQEKLYYQALPYFL